jgi:hypothetical protein
VPVWCGWGVNIYSIYRGGIGACVRAGGSQACVKGRPQCFCGGGVAITSTGTASMPVKGGVEVIDNTV